MQVKEVAAVHKAQIEQVSKLVEPVVPKRRASVTHTPAPATTAPVEPVAEGAADTDHAAPVQPRPAPRPAPALPQALDGAPPEVRASEDLMEDRSLERSALQWIQALSRVPLDGASAHAYLGTIDPTYALLTNC
eukprot:m.1575625 g.1575625  ORF g.1575625 m.1575625 type:complete len:134 (+) comp25308_c0_seq47:3028-3429(+)